MNQVVDAKKYRQWIIFDIDGTLANIKHRLHYINPKFAPKEGMDFKPHWERFNNAMEQDELNKHIEQIYRRMCCSRHEDNYGAIFVTGRPETHRSHTERWLLQHQLIADYLLMRPEGDYRSDVEIKQEILDKYIKKANILFVVDDRDAVVEMWRKNGYKCLQCQKGDY